MYMCLVYYYVGCLPGNTMISTTVLLTIQHHIVECPTLSVLVDIITTLQQPVTYNIIRHSKWPPLVPFL